TEPTKHYVPVQSKDKVDEIINMEGSTSKLYTQVNHQQERLEADKALEEEINKDSNELAIPLEGIPNVDNTVPEPVIPVDNIIEGSQDSSSPEQSEFVANTQVDQITNENSQNEEQNEEHPELPIEPEHFPLLVQKDIQFLYESWANLAEIEEQNALPTFDPLPNLDKLPEIPHHSIDVIKLVDNVSPSSTDNDGFKLVTSRNTKKLDKAKSTKPSAHKTNYITR
ncbi:hypothetical protein A2U01_0019618, partial [Trifolium medium]|nr:hypothetical protein [Trifolium medium]